MSLHPYLSENSKVKVKPEIKKTVGTILEQLQPHMYQGIVGPLRCSQEDVEKIIHEIYQSKRVSKKQCCVFLTKIISYGNAKLGWEIHEVENAYPAIAEKNQITLGTFIDVNKFRVIERNYLKSLESDMPSTFEERFSQILFAVIAYEGLLQRRCIEAFLCAIQNGMSLHGNWLYFELSSSKDKTGNPKPVHSWLKFRRWFAGPLSQILIIRWLKEFPEDLENVHKFNINGFVKNYCRSLGGDTVKIHSLSTFLRLAKSRHLLYFPTFLSCYASGSLNCTSINQRDFFGVVEDKCLAEDKQEEIGKSDADKTYQTFQIEPQGAKNTDINIQISLLTDLLKRDDFTKLKLSNWRTLSDQDRKTYLHEAKTILLDYLKTHQSALTKAHTLLIQWALQLLEKQKDSRERRKSKAPLAVSSVHTYLHRIGTILLIASDDEDLLALKPPDLGVIYEKAVNQKKSENSKIDAIGNLYQFHGYLESVNDDFEEVDFDEIKLNFGLKVRNVKAKIITLSTYQKALKLLGWGQKDLHRRNKIQISILILAFKCGLRYGEIVSLRVFDYQYGPLPVLMIRNHRFHNNKSDRARRLLPLKELLNEHEFEFVKNYFEYRLREYKHMNNELLFGELTKTGGVVHCGELVQPIVDTIRTITGDMKLSFHSLRHSFATWFTVRLMLREDNKQGLFFKSFKDDFFSSETTWKLKKDLFRNRPLGSNYLRALSIIIGHGDPLTTLHHYCHLTDWLLAYYTRHSYCLPNLSVKAIRKITGLGPDRASEIKSKAALAETANRHTQENRHLFSKVNFDTTIPETKNLVVKRSWYLSSWEDTFDKVIKQQTTKKTIPGNEHCFDIPKKKYELTLASELYQNAYALSSKKLPIIREVLLSDQLVFNDKDHVFSLKNRRHGKKVIKALKLLGIEDNQVVVFYDQKQINDSSLPDLAEFLDVAHKSLRPKSVNFKNHSVGGEYLSLRIRRVHSKKIKQQTNMHNYGLNFFIRLLKLGSVR